MKLPEISRRHFFLTALAPLFQRKRPPTFIPSGPARPATAFDYIDEGLNQNWNGCLPITTSSINTTGQAWVYWIPDSAKDVFKFQQGPYPSAQGLLVEKQEPKA